MCVDTRAPQKGECEQGFHRTGGLPPSSPDWDHKWKHIFLHKSLPPTENFRKNTVLSPRNNFSFSFVCCFMCTICFTPGRTSSCLSWKSTHGRLNIISPINTPPAGCLAVRRCDEIHLRNMNRKPCMSMCQIQHFSNTYTHTQVWTEWAARYKERRWQDALCSWISWAEINNLTYW